MGYRSTVCWCSYKVVRHNVQQFNMHASASIISVTCLVTHMHIFHHISVDICTMVHMMHRERQREMHTITWAYKHTRRCILLYRHHVWFLDSWSFCKNSSIQVLETRLWSAVERVERWRNHQQHWWVQPLASAKQAENRWRSLPRRCQWAELARIPRVPKTRIFQVDCKMPVSSSQHLVQVRWITRPGAKTLARIRASAPVGSLVQKLVSKANP